MTSHLYFKFQIQKLRNNIKKYIILIENPKNHVSAKSLFIDLRYINHANHIPTNGTDFCMYLHIISLHEYLIKR